MRPIGATLLFLIACPMDALPQGQVRLHRGSMTAREFLDMPQGARKFYVMGLMDGLFLAPMFGAPANNKWRIAIQTCVEGKQVAQLVAIIEKYIKEHPEYWHADAHFEAYNALSRACPAK
jgi:hypothetical protein